MRLPPALKFIFWTILVLRSLVFPVVSVFRRFVSERWRLEASQAIPQYEKYDYCFEVSSVGELEQAMWPLISLLEKGKSVQLFYCSGSVKRQVEALQEKWGDQLYVRALPILRFSLIPWPGSFNTFQLIKAPVVVFCRYDFFPELILAAESSRCSAVLLSGTLVNKQYQLKREGSFPHWYWQKIYRFFDIIVAASKSDLHRFLRLGVKSDNLVDLEYRSFQIAKRVSQAGQLLEKREVKGDIDRLFADIKRENRIIFGSFWPKEMEVFREQSFISRIHSGEVVVFIAPHEVGKISLGNIEHLWNRNFSSLTLHWWKEGESFNFSEWEKERGPIVMGHKGLLLELYTYFGHVYVGGGHGRSVHSVLEPFLTDSIVYCGPKTHRSTEFETILDVSPEEVAVVDKLPEFYKFYSLLENREIDLSSRRAFVDRAHRVKESITGRIESLEAHAQ